MTPQYILKKSLCRAAHCYSAHVPGQGYVNHGEMAESRPGYDRQRRQTAESEIDNMQWAPDYAEPGYHSPAKGVLFADWNVFPARIDDTLARAGYDVQWSDEWSICDDCGRAVRTSSDCYGWQPYYVMIDDCSIVCLDCVDWPAYLESIEDNPDTAVTRQCDPSEQGYERLSDEREYESGFHLGQNDSPAKILEALHATGRRRIVFRIADVGQFDVHFETWIKTSDEDEQE